VGLCGFWVVKLCVVGDISMSQGRPQVEAPEDKIVKERVDQTSFSLPITKDHRNTRTITMALWEETWSPVSKP